MDTNTYKRFIAGKATKTGSSLTIKSLEQSVFAKLDAQIEANPLAVLAQLSEMKKSQRIALAEKKIEKVNASVLLREGEAVCETKDSKVFKVKLQERKNPDGSVSEWVFTGHPQTPKRIATFERGCAFHGTKVEKVY